VKVQIDVTEGDIKGGVKHSCHYCPVAQAIKRTFKHKIYPRVDVGQISLYSDMPVTLLSVMNSPDSVNEFVFNFDHYNEGKPFSFDMEVSEELAKLARD
jgi:hypothetical protein